ncbi:2-haloacid dehalogenase [Klenkia marina]|uniref:2-haloacid dehalogenase n=1 Tax=Klenkia marina TaxID=1960309 RepID=A0A1G4YNV1_9ACTN|nr:haloacid dehalogenase [Klenkia marina]SCX55123.1 2-haloacid dehalogenase [Klenkia marina]
MFVTLDLFSALVDSRAGAAPVLADLAPEAVDGALLYDEWDTRSKATQRDRTDWVPFAEHCRAALAATWSTHGWPTDDSVALTDRLLASLPDWPLWPDVADALPRLSATHRVGVLSNVDDDLLARTRVAPLVAEADRLTSQRLRAYKPAPALYRRAVGAGVDVHVPASARDTRGALEAGLLVVRVARPGHRVDPAGPRPAHVVTDLHDLPAVLESLDVEA